MEHNIKVKVSVEGDKKLDGVNAKLKELKERASNVISAQDSAAVQKFFVDSQSKQIQKGLESAIDQIDFTGAVDAAIDALKDFFSIFQIGLGEELQAEKARWRTNVREMSPEQLAGQKLFLEERQQDLQQEINQWWPDPFVFLPHTHAETYKRIDQTVNKLEYLAGFHDAKEIYNGGGNRTVGFKASSNAKEAKLPPIDVWGTIPKPQPISTTTPQSLFGGLDLGKPKLSKVPTAPPEQTKKQAKETFTELTALSESFQSSFDAGMSAVGQSINQSIGGMFRGVFGEANSLLEIFIANFVTQMASNVLSLLTGGASGGILSILGFAKGGIISEPIFGIGKSGQRYLFGEAGREAVIPFSEMAASAQFTRNYPAPFKPGSVIAETKVSGSDLLVILKYASVRTGRTTF